MQIQSDLTRPLGHGGVRRIFGAIGLSIALAVPSAALAQVQPGAAAEVRGDADFLLDLVGRHATAAPADRQRAAMEILAQSPAELGAVLDVLMYRRTLPAGVLPEASERVLLRLLASWPEGSVTRAIAGEAQDRDFTRTLRALELFAGVGRGPAVPAVFVMVSALSPEQQQQQLVRDRFEAAIAGALARDERAVDQLANEIRGADSRWLPAVASALAVRGGEDALRLLEGLLGRDPKLDEHIVGQLGQWTRWSRSATDCSRLVERQLDVPEASVRRTAAATLGKLQSGSAVRALIAALDDEDARTRYAVRWALEEITGQRAASSEEQWSAWLVHEEAWLEGRAAELIEGLAEADASAATHALQEFAAHPWFADQLVSAIQLLLRREELAVATVACEALLRCGTPEACEALVEALMDARDELRDAAWQALCALTGERLPPEVGVWAEFLES